MINSQGVGKSGEPSGTAWYAPFSIAVFRNMWLGQFATNTGMMVHSLAAAWVMTTLTTSPIWIASVQVAVNAPVMIWALAAGILADRYDRRLVILAAQSLFLGAASLAAAIAWLDMLSPLALVGLTFLIGTGAALRGPAWNAAVVEQVGPNIVRQAVSLNAIAFNTARCVGPALGGFIIARWGADTAFAVNALLACLMIQALVTWRRPIERVKDVSAAALIRGTWALLVTDAGYRSLLIRVFSFGFCGSAIWSLMPIVANQQFGSSAEILGLLFTAFGLGSIMGAFAMPLVHKLPSHLAQPCTILAYYITMLALPFCNGLWLGLSVLLIAGLAWVITLALFNVKVQFAVPADKKGRAFALYQMMIFGGMALGALLWGNLTELFGLVTAFVAAAGVGALTLVIAPRGAARA